VTPRLIRVWQRSPTRSARRLLARRRARPALYPSTRMASWAWRVTVPDVVVVTNSGGTFSERSLVAESTGSAAPLTIRRWWLSESAHSRTERRRAARLLRAPSRVPPRRGPARSGLLCLRTAAGRRLLPACLLLPSVRRGRYALRSPGCDSLRTTPSRRTRALEELTEVLRTQVLQVVPRPDLDRHGLRRGLPADIADQNSRFQTGPPWSECLIVLRR